MNFLTALLANAGINVGAAAGEVKASGDVFALGKAKGLQAQLQDFSVVNQSSAIVLTTTAQAVPGVTLTFTPAVNEVAMMWINARVYFGGGSVFLSIEK